MANKSATTAAEAGRGTSAEPNAGGVFALEGDVDSDLRKQWSSDAARGFSEIKYIY
jgi:hypothetical protein